VHRRISQYQAHMCHRENYEENFSRCFLGSRR
jgi:hypothetical protein